MARPSKRFFEGQTPPKLEIYSQDNLDWYKEQLDRCKNGYSWKGDSMTGDQYWFHNLQPMMVAIFDSSGKPTGDFEMKWAFWSQDDDYLFKQIEEARQDGFDVMVMTARGYGKTYIVLSIGTKIFYTVPNSHGVISASGEDHANETWNKFSDGITAINTTHPTIARGLITNNDKFIETGHERTFPVKETVIYGRMEKKVYDKRPGKTKGRRLNYQHFEEVGDWGGAAKLPDCIAASEGAWKAGSIKKARVFYTGTGGTVLSNQAKEIFYNPKTFNLYTVKNWSERGTAIMIPGFKKYGGFWEKDGVSDEVGAKAHIEQIRADKLTNPDPLAYNKFVQEYPFNPTELFTLISGNRFPKDVIARNLTLLEEFPELRKGKFVNLHLRKREDGTPWVEVEVSPSGKTWILPEADGSFVYKNPEGKAWPRLYVAGYDGIDVGENEAMTTTGSRGSICVKKRLLPGAGISNAYVCFHVDRPANVEEFYEECYKVMILFNLKKAVNIEDTKRGIVGFLKTNKALDYLMNRPRLTLTDPTSEKESKLIGTTATDKNFQYGEQFLINHLKEYGDQFQYVPGWIDLRDFDMNERGKHDITVSMFMCELADDEFMDKLPAKPKEPESTDQYGYYTDSKGKKHWGIIPKGNAGQFNFRPDDPRISHIKNGTIIEST